MKDGTADRKKAHFKSTPSGPDGSSIWECWHCKEFLGTAGTVFNVIGCPKCGTYNEIPDTRFRPSLGPGFC